MPYVTQTQIQTAIPAPILTDALDDDRDGAADAGVLTAIIASADQAVDAFLSARYTVPFITVPTAVAEASFTFSCERIYDRRPGASEMNPWKARASFWRERLQKIGDNELPLNAGTTPAFNPGSAITSAMVTAASTL